MLASLWQPVRSDEWMVALQNSPLRENLVALVVEEVQFMYDERASASDKGCTN